MTMDMTKVIEPKSDQLNSDDLISGSITIRIRDMDVNPSAEQKCSVFFEGDNGKPYKPCKSMAKVMVAAWGPDAKKYIGRSMTLYRDPTVKWGGMEVGGIRISHMSDIAKGMTMALTVTRGNKKPYVVQPLVDAPKPVAEPVAKPATPSASDKARAAADGIIAEVKAGGDIGQLCEKHVAVLERLEQAYPEMYAEVLALMNAKSKPAVEVDADFLPPAPTEVKAEL